ncbi:unnamed protein product [Acanthoscelides obtectus]|uniref:DOMON domain-containing protein n=1 Tax=Acanthoscelides obtectus TaxID=200917 RepID=A0A9P0Q482_ACAOB|nr:unnamed protein product [Acanthoscelides obtectus]CAK1626519.1 Protein Skeletor, isoforms B/C [Acanthoscelides obtectus]
MSFGLSGDNQKSVMVGGDVVVAWVDKNTLKGFAEDYYLNDKSQCSGPTGSCPDNRLNQQAVNNIRLLNAAAVNGYSIVTYQRPLAASDKFDRDVLTNGSQAIIWAIGPLNERNEVSFHTKYLKGDKLVEFGRPARWNCPAPEEAKKSVASSAEEQTPQSTINATPEPVRFSTEEPVIATSSPASRRTTIRRRGGGRPQTTESDFGVSRTEAPQVTTPQSQRRRGPQRGTSTRDSIASVKEVPTPTPVKTRRDAWEIPDIQCYEPEDGVFYAQMGPTGGKRGYPAITGHVGWGISWYINGLLIPVIHVVRGKTYTFVVEGGLDPEVSAKYHPFYITDDPVGGYAYKTPEERKAVNVFAGVRKAKDGSLVPTGTGRLCHWTQSGDLEADDYPSFGAYQRSLELKCDPGEPGVIQWTPDESTPDTVYYQCFTHRYLGWKIIVHDTCDGQATAASSLQEVAVAPPADFQDKSDVDLADSPSIQVETMVKANDISKEAAPAKTYAQSAVVSESPVTRPDPPPSPTEHTSSTQSTLADDPFFRWNRPLWQQTPKYFRPSTLLNETPESTNFHFAKLTTTSSTTTTTTSTTTTTTTEKPVDNVAIPSSTMNETFLLPPPPMHVSRQPVYHNRPSMHYPIKLRQPFLAPRPNLMVPPKSKYQWTPPKLVYPNRPYQFEQTKYFPAKPTLLPQKQATMKPAVVEETKFKGQVHDVEISPQQPSTEREPEIQTVASPAILDITPVYVKPAYNIGFRSGSIKMESGFKPIISKDFQDRMDEEVDEPQVEPEGETGVIEVDGEEKYEPKPIQVFEPMFVPSPTDKPVKPTKRKVVHKRPVVKQIPEYTKIVVKHTRSLPDPIEEDQKAEAAERVESYYLPPADQKQKPMQRISQPSNIDIEAPEEPVNIDSPPDVVVSYDGKRLSGQSLTAKVSDRTPNVEPKLSKASAFIRARPQFGKFKGELPPLNPEFINKNAPQLQTGSLSRSLDTPPPSGSTRLSKVGSRSKREAHHTPEHTAQQEAERKMNSSQKSSAVRVSNSLSVSFAVLYILGYLCFT